ncbi:hypothetical protein COLO4_24028 [Corchorus olitorius]|uniref:Uncharacterized protein n=1 Tax=Corchorus olitorius TaxID=93759 RepID=A0A1R3IDC0_9ROSI|nr:hypothetical protein COLO4_24028 [Corchorus olitorius]
MDIKRMLNEQMRKIEHIRGLPNYYDMQEKIVKILIDHNKFDIMNYLIFLLRNLLTMDFGLSNSDIGETSQMGVLRAAALTNLAPFPTTSTPSAEREGLPPLDFSFVIPTNNPFISEIALDLNVTAALLPIDRTYTLVQIPNTKPFITETTAPIIPLLVNMSDDTKSSPPDVITPFLTNKRKRSNFQDGSSEGSQPSSEEFVSKKLLTKQFISLEVKEETSSSQVPIEEEEHDLFLGLGQAVPQQPPQSP